MTYARLALASLWFYRRTHAAVALGVAGAVAVLAGSLLVGSSVSDSLASLAKNRLGNAALVVGAEQPFTEDFTARLSSRLSARTAPLLSLTGTVRHEASGRRAGDVQVYGVDERFFAFHGVDARVPARTGAWLSSDLARELGAMPGDAVVVRVARPTDIPLDSLHGRREESGRSMRVDSEGTLDAGSMGDFSLTPAQGPVRAIFLSLARLQRDLDLAGRVNTALVSAGPSLDTAALREAISETSMPADIGLRVGTLPGPGAETIVESASGLVGDDVASAVVRVASSEGRTVTSVLAWLANRITVNGRTIPYSLVTALGPSAGGDAALAAALGAATTSPPPIVLNEWAARDLGAKPGDALELEYFRWADEGRLVTERTEFRVSGIVPMRGLAVDRRLAPDYPGITSARDFADWDPPFPIDLGLIRKQDEAYWDQYRTSPKAFIPLETGQSLWRSRYGQVTSLRVSGTGPVNLPAGVYNSIRVVNVSAQNLAASAGATDFGAYFSYFSFFLMVAALLLAGLFFRLSIEQRLPQIGVLRAAGFSIATIRRAFTIESAGVAAAGVALGVVFAVAWAALMMYALRTWWVGAVGTTLLELHVRPSALAIGGAGGALAAWLSLVVTIRGLSRQSPRSQLAGTPAAAQSGARSRARWLAPATFVLAGALTVASVSGIVPAAGGFFGAGALVLAGGLAGFRAWLARAGRARQPAATGLSTLSALGLRNASWRPGRSTTVAGLVAAAVFLLVSVDSFRKTVGAERSINSGTGGFSLVAESSVPIVHDLQSPDGREAAGLDASGGALDGVTIYGLRLRPGDDASCLNLYQPKRPRIVGVPERLVRENRFRFARVLPGANEAQRRNPWTLLEADGDDEIPAIVDQTSLQYVLHAAVGDTLVIDADTSRPLTLRIVASLDDTVLQGEILVGDRAFQRAFPALSGSRMFLVGIEGGAADREDAVAQRLERGLDAFGFDAQSAAEKLAAYHRVENTYLSTFQALGGLGLVLGCLGLVAVVLRNVLERRRELALLGAAGFTGRQLQRVVLVEHVALVGWGLAVGVAAAAIAVGPVAVTRSGTAPWQALVWLVPVAAAGLAAAYGATRSLRRMALVPSLRNE